MVIKGKRIFLVTLILLVSQISKSQNPDPPAMLIIQVEPTNNNPGQVKVIWSTPNDNIEWYQFHKWIDIAGVDSRFKPYPENDAKRADTSRVDVDGQAHLKSEKYSVVAWDFDGVNSILAEAISSLYLSEVNYDSCLVTATLNWSAFDGTTDGAIEYEIWRQVNNGDSTYYTTSQDTFFTDYQLSENTNYTYHIQVQTSYGLSISNEQNLVVTTPSVPQEEQNILAIDASEDLVAFTVQVDADVNVISYDLMESVSGEGIYTLAQSMPGDGTSERLFTRPHYEQPRFYRMQTLGICDIYVDTTNIVQPIVLVIDQQGSEVDLIWNEGFYNEEESYVVKVWADGIPEESILLDSKNDYQLNIDEFGSEQTEVFEFQIIAESDEGFQSFSNIVMATRLAAVTMPNAFTPNGDKLNDKIGPFNKTYAGTYVYFKNADVSSFTNFEIIIYDKYGGRVFESNDLSSFWDGTFGGYPVSEGPYLYTINYTTGQDKSFSHSGTLTVLYPYKRSSGN